MAERGKRRRKVRYPGRCLFCGSQLSRKAMAQHLSACDARGTGSEDALRLFVESTWYEAYWLHIEVPTSSALLDLDSLLRSTWLECCDHLSNFKIGGICYSSSPMTERFWGPLEQSLTTKIADVLGGTDRFHYTYDLSASTELKGYLVGRLTGVDPSTGPRVVARNEQPDLECHGCGESSGEICTGCGQWFCPACGVQHPQTCQGRGNLVPIVNSPRTGVCTYRG